MYSLYSKESIIGTMGTIAGFGHQNEHHMLKKKRTTKDPGLGLAAARAVTTLD